MDNIRGIEQWYQMNKADNLDNWLKAIESISVPMFNTGYADKEGNIFFVYGANIPNRNQNYDWGKVLPGNTSETLWETYKSFDLLPKVLNPKSGFIQNCNSSPFMTTIGDGNPNEEDFDHTYGIEIPSLAVACGASIIEKHFTDNIKLRQSDNFFSVTSDEVMEIKQNTKRIFSFMHNKNEKTEDYMRDFKKYID